ncbi:MAG: HlyD family efflux transporter periplasmic adaptor subunit, partial [Gammaproteobacteria bacterium]|nr:HlyD family efflux transporter periplasmic adaptor subunit [Gammaproteobacteria bacterium]
MMRRIVPVLVVLALVTGGVWLWRVRTAENPDAPLVLSGNVDIRQVSLGFRVGGRIAGMNFEEGKALEAGALMAVLDKRPFEDDLQLAEAEVAAQRATLQKFLAGSRPEEIAQARALVNERQAALDNASLALRRAQRLVSQGHLSQQSLDDALVAKAEAAARVQSAREALDLALEGFRQEDVAVARANLRMAEARRARAQTNLDDTRLVAPSDGVVLSRIQEPGAIVAQGTPVYTLSLVNPVWIRAYVSEPDLGRV